jgi:predicted RNA-binding protein
MLKETNNKGAEGGGEEMAKEDIIDLSKIPPEEFKELSPETVESCIELYLGFLSGVFGHLRSMFRGDIEKIWDELEREAKKTPGKNAPPEERKELLRRLKNFTLVLKELDSLLEKQKREAEDEERKKISA